MSGAINVLVCPGCAISTRAQPVLNRPAGHSGLAPETDAQPRTEIRADDHTGQMFGRAICRAAIPTMRA